MTQEHWDHLTMADLCIGTGSTLKAYDNRQEAEYWPPLQKTNKGYIQVRPVHPATLERKPELRKDPSIKPLEPGEPLKQDPRWLEEELEMPPSMIPTPLETSQRSQSSLFTER